MANDILQFVSNFGKRFLRENLSNKVTEFDPKACATLDHSHKSFDRPLRRFPWCRRWPRRRRLRMEPPSSRQVRRHRVLPWGRVSLPNEWGGKSFDLSRLHSESTQNLPFDLNEEDEEFVVEELE